MKLRASTFITSLKLSKNRTLLTHISGIRRLICDNSALKFLEKFNSPTTFKNLRHEFSEKTLKIYKHYLLEARLLIPADLDEKTELLETYTSVFPEAEKILDEAGSPEKWTLQAQVLEGSTKKKSPLSKRWVLSKNLTVLHLPHDEVLITHPLRPQLFISKEFWSLALLFSKEASLASAVKAFKSKYPPEKIEAACDLLLRNKILVNPLQGDKESILAFLNYFPIDEKLSIQPVHFPLFLWSERTPPYRIKDCQTIKFSGTLTTVGPCQINFLVPPLIYIAERAGLALSAYPVVEDYSKLRLENWMAVLVSPTTHVSRLYESFIHQKFEEAAKLLPKILSELDYKIHQIRAHTPSPILFLSVGKPGLSFSEISSGNLLIINKILSDLNFQILECLKKYPQAYLVDEERLVEYFSGNTLDDEFTSTPHHAVWNLWNYDLDNRFVDRASDLPPPPSNPYPPSIYKAEGLFKALLRLYVTHPLKMIAFNPSDVLWNKTFLEKGFTVTQFIFEKGVHEALCSLKKAGVLLACLTPESQDNLDSYYELSREELRTGTSSYWLFAKDLNYIKTAKDTALSLQEVLKESHIPEKNALLIDFSQKDYPHFKGRRYQGDKWALRKYLLASIETTALGSASDPFSKERRSPNTSSRRDPAASAKTPFKDENTLEKSFNKALKHLLKCSEEDLGRTDDLRLLGLDSLGGLELLLRLEKETGISIKDYELTSAIIFSRSALFNALLRSFKEQKKGEVTQPEETYDSWCGQTVADLFIQNFESPKVPWILKWVNSSKPFDYTYITWEQLKKGATTYLSLFQQHGIVQGDIVTLLLPQSFELAAAEVGAILGGILPSICAFPSEKLSEEAFADWFGKIIEKSDSKLIVCHPDFRELVLKLLAEASLSVPVISDSTHHENLPPPLFPQIKNRDPVLLQHSSGTTGLKKAVILNNRALLAQAWHLKQG